MSEVMPEFKVANPTSLDEAVKALQDNPDATPLAGGTDLIVRMRRGLSETNTLVDLTGIPDLTNVSQDADGLHIGAGVTLAALEKHPAIAEFPAILRAIKGVAGPSHRESATLGGNLCLDTRCVYYNQSHWWRKSNAFCLKYRGDICHVAPKGNRCRAAFSGDIAPALMVLGAEITLAGPGGTRRLALADFYHEDGAAHTDLQPGEILVSAHIPQSDAVSDYHKIRVRGSVDFPLAGIAVACTNTTNGALFTLAVTGTNSKPVLIKIEEPLRPSDDADAYFAAMNKDVQKAVSPQRTTTIEPHYRRLSIAATAARLARAMV